jgi:hypothetical protein
MKQVKGNLFLPKRKAERIVLDGGLPLDEAYEIRYYVQKFIYHPRVAVRVQTDLK